jgi:hypothetical protein
MKGIGPASCKLFLRLGNWSMDVASGGDRVIHLHGASRNVGKGEWAFTDGAECASWSFPTADLMRRRHNAWRNLVNASSRPQALHQRLRDPTARVRLCASEFLRIRPAVL